MKNFVLFFVLFCFAGFHSKAQTTADRLFVQDSRNLNDAPNFLSHSFQLDFKNRSIIGAPGEGTYSANLTIAPWADASGGLNHQLNFNDGGIFYRTGSHSSTTWNTWKKILIESDGKIGIGGTNSPQYPLDLQNTTPNSTKAVFRLDEGTLAIKAYNAQPIDCKMFAIEHRFYDTYINSAINFYRGGNQLGGWMTFSVYDGREICKLSYLGMELFGTLYAKNVVVSSNWADFVFAKDYELPSLSEVKQYITENKRLPDIPSEQEVKETGVNLGDMQTKLLQKIEELTLYTIQQQEMIDKLNARIEKLENK